MVTSQPELTIDNTAAATMGVARRLRHRPCCVHASSQLLQNELSRLHSFTLTNHTLLLSHVWPLDVAETQSV